jgi:hypothetical protein
MAIMEGLPVTRIQYASANELTADSYLYMWNSVLEFL